MFQRNLERDPSFPYHPAPRTPRHSSASSGRTQSGQRLPVINTDTHAILSAYITAVSEAYVSGKATEHSYRPAIKALIDGLVPVIVEYRDFGFCGEEPTPENSVSFQIDFNECAPDNIRVSYFKTHSDEVQLSDRALGSRAALTASTENERHEYSSDRPSALPGLTVVYHFGTVTDPLQPDTDGDGMDDGWENENGFDPLEDNGQTEREDDDFDADPDHPGWTYDVTLQHISTEPNFASLHDPDYDYRLVMTPLETPVRVILEDPSGLFGTNVNNAAATFTTSPKTARLHVLKPTIAISKSSIEGWNEMDEGEVVLSDEDLKIGIQIKPKVTSMDEVIGALGGEYTIFTATKPEGASVAFSATDPFVQNDDSSEIRITKTRAELKTLGLLPANEEDGVDEMAWVDIVQTQGQSYADSEAFATLGYAFRGKATLDATQSLESSPPISIPTASFFKAAGCELISVAYGGATSAKRQIMNQADISYFSGHGNHNTGTIQSGFSPQMAAQYWCDDLDCVIIAGCSVLDINDYNNNFPGLAHLLSPGKAWEQTGPNILLGYCYKAPLDSTGAPARIVSQWMVNRSVQGDVAAWMNANDNRNGRNACAIEKGLRFHYFRRSFKHFYTHKTFRKEDWQ